ncbi:MAG TPA: nucleotidyltransferase domain-containing protein [Polyangia bacterium]|nr:nucleotidyltransferase domain-containing protein [Polyangia bacterium]
MRALSSFMAAVRADLSVEAAYLYGSVARGESEEGSDVDIAVVSPAFRGMRRVDVIAFLFERTRGLGFDLQPIGLCPEDLGDEDNVIARAIADDGVPLAID